MRRKVFLLYPYYYPHYKAGGPVQSVYNLAGCFKNEAEFFFISLDKDMDGVTPEMPVMCGAWQRGPQGESIYYTPKLSFHLVQKLFAEVRPDVVFVNGLFNIATTLPGVLCAKLYRRKLIISPRGMLQPWALRQSNTLIKKIFIRVLRLVVGLRVTWHATDELEKQDILKHFGSRQKVHIASNVARPLRDYTGLPLPDAGPVRLVFLSLINPNKNLHLVIEALKRAEGKFVLDIFGPVADRGYWNLCLEKMEGMKDIRYHGPVVPWEVPDVLQHYHFFVLPTQGENFGHAIFDALSSSVPVIVSRNTPWKDIDTKGAGYYVDLDGGKSLTLLLSKIGKLSPKEYDQLRQGAHQYAGHFLSGKDYRWEYQFLVGV